MKVGILGAGHIANAMATAIQGLDGVVNYAIASRSLEKAEGYKEKYGFVKAYGSYEEMVSDPEVDLVYVATPHSHHYEHVKLCLEHGKAVLCEKAFTMNANQAKEIIRMAEEKKILLTEAIWTRYMPSRKMINDLIASGVIGEVTSLSANLGYVLSHLPRNAEPALAGGALLDLGVYPINFASMIFGTEVESITSDAVLSEKGVDDQNSIVLRYADGKMAYLYSTQLAHTDREGIISGNQGYIKVENINNVQAIRVYDTKYQMTAEYKVPEQINGYEYEVLACKEALEKGEIECPQMPHAETVRIMELMDRLRRDWGVIYPGEE